ncbi:hypothetical protein AMAG_01376 [Allomyces macrogynus ATCC 38327]|uniref:Vacuolar protein sorting-associated protein 26 n=1 Tax=Allomyces macrogynus (strain ATCC 38327) TaxID=578462 RepID=A0A0L0RYP4_ALLM3|nr:hypothetical protein AMAG_01376 [Allomyces macrogynus ATCC 38327]|eukprot:KNE55487.1 hypothetical protein AMAG_01376 [Allomyces macrogynus ATCC 38327]
MNVPALFGLGTNADVDIRFDGEEQRQWVDVKVNRDQRDKFPLYADGETVTGKVTIRVKDGKKLEHAGIRVQFLGQIEAFPDKQPNDFISMGQELMAAGEIRGLQTFAFEFKNVEKQFESYLGTHVKLRYFVRVTISRRLSDIVREKDLWVYSYKVPPDQNHPIKMEVGIEECLHIEFEYNKSRYHLSDVIVGKIYFLLVRIKIKYMELSILRRESTAGMSPANPPDPETLAKFEIMDGAPVKGEMIPIRMFLSGYELTPTFRDVNKKFSVRYFLNLVLVDEENRRYFKQQEITMFREPLPGMPTAPVAPVATASAASPVPESAASPVSSPSPAPAAAASAGAAGSPAPAAAAVPVEAVVADQPLLASQ